MEIGKVIDEIFLNKAKEHGFIKGGCIHNLWKYQKSNKNTKQIVIFEKANHQKNAIRIIISNENNNTFYLQDILSDEEIKNKGLELDFQHYVDETQFKKIIDRLTIIIFEKVLPLYEVFSRKKIPSKEMEEKFLEKYRNYGQYVDHNIDIYVQMRNIEKDLFDNKDEKFDLLSDMFIDLAIELGHIYADTYKVDLNCRGDIEDPFKFYLPTGLEISFSPLLDIIDYWNRNEMEIVGIIYKFDKALNLYKSIIDEYLELEKIIDETFLSETAIYGFIKDNANSKYWTYKRLADKETIYIYFKKEKSASWGDRITILFDLDKIYGFGSLLNKEELHENNLDGPFVGYYKSNNEFKEYIKLYTKLTINYIFPRIGVL